MNSAISEGFYNIPLGLSYCVRPTVYRMEPSRKPLNVLIKSIGSNVTINLKGHGEYWGKMTRVDGYMNIMLKGAKEYDQGGLVASYGDVFVRGNNIVYISINPENPPSPKEKAGKEEDDDEPN